MEYGMCLEIPTENFQNKLDPVLSQDLGKTNWIYFYLINTA